MNMKRQELLKRLRTLAKVGAPTQTVLIAPLNMAYARDLIDEINSEDTTPSNLTRFEGQVTSQDLADLIEWIDALEAYAAPTHES